MSGPLRNLGEVLDGMSKLLPAEDRPALAAFVDRMGYKAPEQMHGCWAEFQAWLFGRIGLTGAPPFVVQPGEEWKARALALWAAKSVEQMRQEGLLVWEGDRAADAIIAARGCAE